MVFWEFVRLIILFLAGYACRFSPHRDPRIPATEFAERSDVTGKLQWDWVPSDCVVAALLDHRTATPLLKILTRASTDAELHKYEHPRMPLLLARRFAVLPLEEPEPDLFF